LHLPAIIVAAARPSSRRAAARLLAAAVALVLAGCGSGTKSPGGEIVFTGLASAGGGSDLYAIDADGSDLRRLTRDGGDSGPSPSPDGAAVAVARWSSGGCRRPRRDCARIWLVSAAGRDVRPLTPPSERSESPAWSPDGATIAYVRWRDDANPYADATDIYSIPAAGGRGTRLTHGLGDAADPAWSPDGRQIAFTSDLHGNYDIYVMDADGTHVRRLTRTPVPELAPAWSPDGREIAYAAPDGVHVIGADGSGGRLVTGALPGAGEPAWSPDGKRLVVLRSTGAGAELYLIDSSGSNPQWLDTGAVVQPGDPSWTSV
jgi:Tol biopolymer transport system component